MLNAACGVAGHARYAWLKLPLSIMVMLVSACSPVAVLNALSPRTGPGTRLIETSNVAYAPGERRSLDIYAPIASAENRTADSAGAPVVVFIYGGGWKEGDKAAYRFVAAALARRGFLTVVPDYRLYPAVRFPVFLQDAADAVAWTRANIARYGGDPHQLYLMGHSAGAHIVTMLTLDRQWLMADGLDPDHTISGTVALAGPYDFLPLHDPELERIFAPAGNLRLTQPITFARGNAPPLFLATGTSDTTVMPGNTDRLAAAIRHDGGQIEEKRYPGIGHSLILGAIAAPLRWFAPVLRDTTDFLDRHSRARGTSPPLSNAAAAAS